MIVRSLYWTVALKNASVYFSLGILFLFHFLFIIYGLDNAKTFLQSACAFAPFLSFFGIAWLLTRKVTALEVFWPHLLGIGFLLDDEENKECHVFKKYLPPKALKKYEDLCKKRQNRLSSRDYEKIRKSWPLDDMFWPYELEAQEATKWAKYLIIPKYATKEEIKDRSRVFFEETDAGQEIKALRQKNALLAVLPSKKEESNKKSRKM